MALSCRALKQAAADRLLGSLDKANGHGRAGTLCQFDQVFPPGSQVVGSIEHNTLSAPKPALNDGEAYLINQGHLSGRVCWLLS